MLRVPKSSAMLDRVYEQIERVIDLTDPALNHLYAMSVEDARALVLEGSAESVSRIRGSFALIAKRGRTVRMARSLDRPLRYFLAKRKEGPALIVSDRIDSIYDWLKSEGLHEQFRPNYTRMVPAHYVVELQLGGLPRPGSCVPALFYTHGRRIARRSRCDRPGIYLRTRRRDLAVAPLSSAR